MSLLIGGVIAAILGLVGLIEWRQDFFMILKGAIPISLLLGGILAIYVGFDDMQEKIREEREKHKDELEKAKEEIELLKSIAETNREELNRLKKDANQTKL